MNTEKTLVQLLENIDTNYMSEFEKAKAIANAERAEAISDGIIFAVRAIKQFTINIKNVLTHMSPKGQQA
ncbi:hypothetical protein [Marinomonas sp. 2405UD68-3]|uniref:hypothetical protein n=1 Tax=Marinomonas sp. 2405UD68-3 TaxID=3391835 RepID=UPI0039C98E1A